MFLKSHPHFPHRQSCQGSDLIAAWWALQGDTKPGSTGGHFLRCFQSTGALAAGAGLLGWRWEKEASAKAPAVICSGRMTQGIVQLVLQIVDLLLGRTSAVQVYLEVYLYICCLQQGWWCWLCRGSGRCKPLFYLARKIASVWYLKKQCIDTSVSFNQSRKVLSQSFPLSMNLLLRMNCNFWPT